MKPQTPEEQHRTSALIREAAAAGLRAEIRDDQGRLIAAYYPGIGRWTAKEGRDNG